MNVHRAGAGQLSAAERARIALQSNSHCSRTTLDVAATVVFVDDEVNSAPKRGIQELFKTIPNGQVGVRTVGQIQNLTKRTAVKTHNDGFEQTEWRRKGTTQ